MPEQLEQLQNGSDYLTIQYAKDAKLPNRGVRSEKEDDDLLDIL